MDQTLTDIEGVMQRLREKRSRTLTVHGLFRYGWEEFKGEFVTGANVCFEREPDNKVDPNAVKVVLPCTRQVVGYVAKEYAREISCDLRKGGITNCEWLKTKLWHKSGVGNVGLK